RPAAASTSPSETPVHSAHPTPPFVQGLPSAGGDRKERPLPPHSSTMHRVLVSKLRFSSRSVSRKGRSTSPSTMHDHSSGSAGGGGNRPLLRTKKREAGVVSSSRRLSGVSATGGVSPITRREALS